MWHSHNEKEITNYDIFPGGMMTMLVVEPPGTTHSVAPPRKAHRPCQSLLCREGCITMRTNDSVWMRSLWSVVVAVAALGLTAAERGGADAPCTSSRRP